jgi:aryl-alcohol dehydrogenase-like predicted oxidoreductase
VHHAALSTPTQEPALPSRRIGPFDVPGIGLGCMNLSHAYGAPPPAEAAERLLLSALDAGVTLFDTAALFGFGANETLIGRVLKAQRQRIVLCSKGGMAGVSFADGVKRVIDGRPAAIRRNCEDSPKRLQTEVIDVYYLHRWHKEVPVEDSVGEMSRLVERGWVRALGLCEVSAATLMKAHAVHPIAAVQTEYSLWTRNPEIAVLKACRDIGAAFVAFSPVARGFLSDAPPVPADFDAKDIRRGMPRFAPENWSANLALQQRATALANQTGCTLAQLALAWLLTRGEHVLAIPGTTNPAHLRENAAAGSITVTADVLHALGALIDTATVAGERYGAQASGEVDTEVFGSLAG